MHLSMRLEAGQVGEEEAAKVLILELYEPLASIE